MWIRGRVGHAGHKRAKCVSKVEGEGKAKAKTENYGSALTEHVLEDDKTAGRHIEVKVELWVEPRKRRLQLRVV